MNKGNIKYISVNIDGNKVKAPIGSTVLEAASRAGIYIPTLCYLDKLKSYGGCRLCIVQIKNMKGFPTACTTPVSDNMEISTKTPELQSIRREILQLILSEHPYTCLVCNDKNECREYMNTIRKVSVTTGCNFCTSNGDCELQDLAEYLEIDDMPYPISYKNIIPVTDNPFYRLDYNLCILCGRCIRICNEVRHSGILAFVQRGNSTIVGTAFGESQKDAGCEYCGACVDVCPTGSISEKMGGWIGVPDNSKMTVCPLCSVGCTMNVNTKNSRIVNIGPKPGKRTDPYQLCVRGKFIPPDITHHPERITKPHINKNNQWIEITWDKALDFISDKLKKYTGKSFGIIGTPHDTVENAYVMQKFSRTVMKSNNIDIFPSYCDTSLIERIHQYHETTPAVKIDEIIEADTIFSIGSNASISHPIIENKIRIAHHSGKKIIAANSHITRTFSFSDYTSVYNPGAETIFLFQILKAIHNYSKSVLPYGVDKSLENYDAKIAEKATGVKSSYIKKITESIIKSKNIILIAGDTLFLSQNSKENLNLLFNIRLALKKINDFRIMFLIDDGNRYGSVYAGMHPRLLPDFLNLKSKADKWTKLWNNNIPISKGLTSDEMVSKIPDNGIKAIYLAGDIPPHKNLKKLKFFIQQNMFISKTSKYADIILPLECFTESSGHIINIERKLKEINPVIPSPDSVKPFWEVLSLIAKKTGNNILGYSNQKEIYKEMNDNIDLAFKKEKHIDLKTEQINPTIKNPKKKQHTELLLEPNYFHYHGNILTTYIPDLKLIRDEGILFLSHETFHDLKLQENDQVIIKTSKGKLKVQVRSIYWLEKGKAYFKPNWDHAFLFTDQLSINKTNIQIQIET